LRKKRANSTVKNQGQFMPLRVLLIRHGETIWNLQRRCQGFTDIPLSETGEAQARMLAAALKPSPLGAIISSDLIRARRTAEIIAEPHKLTPKTDARLRELNQGDLEGKNIQDMLADHPALLKQWMETPAETTMPGGESIRSVQARAWRAIEDLQRTYDNSLIAVVGHNLCINSIICRAIGLDLNNFRRLRLENASISELEFMSHGPVLVRVNEINHLRPLSTHKT
jgi:phosphoserine phosphatase